MPHPLDKASLLAALSAKASARGLTIRKSDGSTLHGEKEAKMARWLLGGIRSIDSFSCHLDEGEHTATFRESVLDTSWGISPPGLNVELSSQKGIAVTSARAERTVGGGGNLEFGEWRDECAATVIHAGWRFNYEALCAP